MASDRAGTQESGQEAGTGRSMTVTVTIRPKYRTQIHGLPWTGKPGDNYAILEECIADRIEYHEEGEHLYSLRGARWGEFLARTDPGH
jgi:hypothetical protein